MIWQFRSCEGYTSARHDLFLSSND